jgi:hypothetical protein
MESIERVELLAEDKSICIFAIYDNEQYGEGGYQWQATLEEIDPRWSQGQPCRLFL